MKTKTLRSTWLIGKNVRLRALEPEDVPLLKRCHLPIDPKGSVFVVETRDGREVGVVGLHAMGWRANVGWAFAGRREKGLGAEALRLLRFGTFKSMPLVRMQAVVPADDVDSLVAYQRAGFKREGILRDALRAGAKYRDAIVVSALRDI